jgi:hypothetical protein
MESRHKATSFDRHANHGMSRLAANALGPNVKEEVDTNEGPQTLAVVLQYQGV